MTVTDLMPADRSDPTPGRGDRSIESAGGDVVLETVALTTGYGDLAAVRDLSIQVRAGEIVALFGANGAGKTTTLLACMGMLAPMSGEVRWRGSAAARSMTQLARDGVAYVPEGRSVITALNVSDNLALGRGSISAALEMFPELEPLLGRPAGLLSGGEQQMLVLGRALAGRPRVLLVDELSLGLAPLIVDRLLAALRDAARQHGMAVLLVEQQAREALSIADRWYLLSDGTLAASGDTKSGAASLEAAFRSTVIGGGVANT